MTAKSAEREHQMPAAEAAMLLEQASILRTLAATGDDPATNEALRKIAGQCEALAARRGSSGAMPYPSAGSSTLRGSLERQRKA